MEASKPCHIAEGTSLPLHGYLEIFKDELNPMSRMPSHPIRVLASRIWMLPLLTPMPFSYWHCHHDFLPACFPESDLRDPRQEGFRMILRLTSAQGVHQGTEEG